VPTLEQLLAELPGVTLNIDIKQRRPPMVRAVLDLLRAHRAEERVILASFHLRTMLEVRAAGFRGETALPRPEIAAMLLCPRPLFSRLPLRGSAAQIPLRAGPLDLGTPAVIERCHRLGLRVDYWTVDEPDLAARLLDAGADGVMTNDPRRLAKVFLAARSHLC
jgi:glycerophosphoryl diester phosphodiesterase